MVSSNGHIKEIISPSYDATSLNAFTLSRAWLKSCSQQTAWHLLNLANRVWSQHDLSTKKRDKANKKRVKTNKGQCNAAGYVCLWVGCSTLVITVVGINYSKQNPLLVPTETSVDSAVSCPASETKLCTWTSELSCEQGTQLNCLGVKIDCFHITLDEQWHQNKGVLLCRCTERWCCLCWHAKHYNLRTALICTSTILLQFIKKNNK